MIPAHGPLPIKDGTPKRKREVKATLALVVILSNHCWCCCYGDDDLLLLLALLLLLLLQSALVDTSIKDHNKPPGPMTELVELRSSKEIVATFGWLEDLSMLVNWLQFLSFFNYFSCFSCQLCQFLLVQLANAHGCCAQFVFIN